MPPLPQPAVVPSPCTNVCRMSPSTGWCEGCFRTIDEIAAWAGMDEGDKRKVWLMLDERRHQAGREPTR